MTDDDEMAGTAIAAVAGVLCEHADCKWQQVGLCVYCTNHGVRLYQGTLPEDKRTTPKCADGQHKWDNADSMGQGGFYFLCLRCGEQDWT